MPPPENLPILKRSVIVNPHRHCYSCKLQQLYTVHQYYQLQDE